MFTKSQFSLCMYYLLQKPALKPVLKNKYSEFFSKIPGKIPMKVFSEVAG